MPAHLEGPRRRAIAARVCQRPLRNTVYVESRLLGRVVPDEHHVNPLAGTRPRPHPSDTAAVIGIPSQITTCIEIKHGLAGMIAAPKQGGAIDNRSSIEPALKRLYTARHKRVIGGGYVTA